MIGLRIELRFRTQLVVPSTARPCDGTLSYSAVQLAENLGADDPISHHLELGLARHVVRPGDDGWCFMASIWHIDWIGDVEVRHAVRTQEADAYLDQYEKGALAKIPAFDPQRGSTRVALSTYPLRWAEKATAYVVAEDEDRVRLLVSGITHLGNRHHHDCGAVRERSVCVDTRSLIRWKERPLPAGSIAASDETHAAGMSTLRPPYWMRERQIPALLPFA